MGTHPIFESDFDCLTENFIDKALEMTGEIELMIDRIEIPKSMTVKEKLDENDVAQQSFLDLLNQEIASNGSKIQEFTTTCLPWLMKNNRWKHIVIAKPTKSNFFLNLMEIIEKDGLDYLENDMHLKIAIGTSVAFESEVLALANRILRLTDRLKTQTCIKLTDILSSRTSLKHTIR